MEKRPPALLKVGPIEAAKARNSIFKCGSNWKEEILLIISQARLIQEQTDKRTSESVEQFCHVWPLSRL